MEILTLQEIAQDFYSQLKNDFKIYGMNESIKVLINVVPVDVLPKYLSVLIYIEWISKYPLVEEKKEV